ncbi:CTD small phosphatase-like protein 3 [Chanos chanos]|uniref:CTD small phosphatase-like protein 3 n=1 Tax=Chanos chanos TaxID=29144 RepID=A0A6J2WA07_CHACN|nr:CTD small phosphatase-like protein 3 [Chanos chanos]
MRLRSRFISEEISSPQSTTPRRSRLSTSRARRTGSSHDDEEVQHNARDARADDVLRSAKRPILRRRKRRAVAKENQRESEFKTPVHRRHLRVHSSTGKKSPPVKSAARHLYSPIVRFLTPTKDNDERSLSGEMMSPEPCVFGYGSNGSPLEEEDQDEVFSPFTFIKNFPTQSKESSPVPVARDIPPKTRSTPHATMVLDLDETLVFSSLSVIENAEHTFHTCFQDHEYKVFLVLRPHVKEFLESMAKIFELFVYTSAKREYAEKIVDILDPKKKLFRHRLYQEDCSCVLGHYVKDLRVLERDLAKTVVLDNSPHTFPYHLMNMIPIKSWFGDKDDRELQRLVPYLEKLVLADDFRDVLKRRTDHFHRLLSED